MPEGSRAVRVPGGGRAGLVPRKVESAVPVGEVRNCAGARRVLRDSQAAAVLLSATLFPVALLVVSRMVKINRYLDALEKGASGFIIPAFYTTRYFTRLEIRHAQLCSGSGTCRLILLFLLF